MKIIGRKSSDPLRKHFLSRLIMHNRAYSSLASTLLSKSMAIQSQTTYCNKYISKGFSISFNFSSSKQTGQDKGTDNNRNQQQIKLKIQRIRQKRIRQIEEEQLKEISRKVNLTKGNYNSFVEYLSLYRLEIGISLLIFLPLYFIIKALIMGGIEEIQIFEEKSKISQRTKAKAEDENTNIEKADTNKRSLKTIKRKKKICLVSQKYQEEKLGDHIASLFFTYYSPIKKEDLSFLLKKRVKQIQEAVSKVLEPKQPYQVVPIATQQPIILSLPQRKILISKSILRSASFSDSELQFLVSLTQQLFNQRYHILNLSPIQIPTFWDIKDAGNEIKLRQIYSTQYKRGQILSNIELLVEKQQRQGSNYSEDRIRQIFLKLERLSKEKKSGERDFVVQNLYRRLRKYYIGAKAE